MFRGVSEQHCGVRNSRGDDIVFCFTFIDDRWTISGIYAISSYSCGDRMDGHLSIDDVDTCWFRAFFTQGGRYTRGEKPVAITLRFQIKYVV